MSYEETTSHSPSSCANLNIRRASRQIGQFFDEQMRESQVRPTQFSLLAMINSLGPASVTEIADALGMERTTLTRNLKLLERDRLVEQTRGEDARVHLYSLSQLGREGLSESRPHWEASQSKFLSRFGEQRWNALRDELQALQDCLSRP